MTFESVFLLVGLADFIGFFIEGCAGFGASVITAPINTGLLSAAVCTPFATAVALPVLWYTVITGHKFVNKKVLLRIFILLAPGFLLGNYLRLIIDETMAKICIGGAVTLIAVINIWAHIIKPLVLKIPDDINADPTPVQRVFHIACLVLGSMVHGAFTIGGPLICVYTLRMVKDKFEFRNTMLAMFAVLDTWNACVHIATNQWNPRVVGAIVTVLPFTFLGYYFGTKLLKKVNREQFLRIIYVVLLATGGNMFIRSLLSIL